MKKRIVAVVLLVVMMFATFTTMSLATRTETNNLQQVRNISVLEKNEQAVTVGAKPLIVLPLIIIGPSYIYDYVVSGKKGLCSLAEFWEYLMAGCDGGAQGRR